MADDISSPEHYCYGNIETKDFIESCGFGLYFYLGNAIKYIARCEHKGDMVKDLRKARQYLDFAIDLVERQEGWKPEPYPAIAPDALATPNPRGTRR